MISSSSSSEGGGGRGRDMYQKRGGQGRSGAASQDAAHLASTLNEVNQNLKYVDRNMADLTNLTHHKQANVQKLAEDVEMMKHQKRHLQSSESRRRYPTSPVRNYDEKALSDWEGRRPPHPAVRFNDDHHDLHQSVRDVSSGHARIEDDMNRLMDRTARHEHDATGAMRDITKALSSTPAASSSVEARLKSIQDALKQEREEKKINTAVSQQLQQVLASKKSNSTAEEELKSRLSHASTHSTMVDDLRQQVAVSEEEKQRLRSIMSKLEEKNRNSQYDEREAAWLEKEKRRLEDDKAKLQDQLAKSAAAISEIGQLRDELNRSETQRIQLSDHIQVLNAEMDQKEKAAAKTILQLQTTSEKLRDTEKSSESSHRQLEDASARLAQLTKHTEEQVGKLRDQQRAIEDANKQRDEVKMRAQATVMQWKAKVKQLQQDVGAYKKSTGSAGTRMEQLIGERDHAHQQAQHHAQQVEQLKRDFSHVMALRSQAEEEVRVKDIQVNELKAIKTEYEASLRDNKTYTHKLEEELHNIRAESSRIIDDRNKYEDMAQSYQATAHMQQNQMQQLEKENKEFSMMRVELAKQLADAATVRQDLKKELSTAQSDLAAAHEELQVLNQQMQQTMADETRRAQEAARYHKKEIVEYEARHHAMSIDLQEEKASARQAKKQNDTLKAELDRLNRELAKSQDETAAMQQTYLQTKENFLAKARETEDGLSDAKKNELQLLEHKQAVLNMHRDHKNALSTILQELDVVIEASCTSQDTVSTLKALSLDQSNQPKRYVAEITGKLRWVGSEVRALQRRYDDMRVAAKIAAAEREDRGEQLLNHAQQQQRPVTPTYQQQQQEQDDSDAEQLDRDISIIQEKEREKEKIVAQYARFQQTMTSLKDDLVKLGPLGDQQRRTRSPGRRVKIAPEERRRCYSPTCPSNSPDPHRNDHSHRRTPSQSPSSSPSRSRYRTPSPHGTRYPNGILKSSSRAEYVPPYTPQPLAMSDEAWAKSLPQTPANVLTS